MFSHNELELKAPIENVWAWLLEAPRWREFYANAWRVRIEGDGPRLGPGTRFRWWTFGVPVLTEVTVFEPQRQLAWLGQGAGSRGFHSWLLEPTPAGCKVVTEETQAGVVVRALAPVLRRGLLYFHQRWMEGLERVAAAGAP